MTKKANPPDKEKSTVYSVKRFRTVPMLLGSIGRNILTSFLIISLITIFILFLTNRSQGSNLYFTYMLMTILASLFAALLVNNISYYRRELRRNRLFKQVQISEEQLFLRLKEDIRSLLQEG
jgi:hypothetical protein